MGGEVLRLKVHAISHFLPVWDISSFLRTCRALCRRFKDDHIYAHAAPPWARGHAAARRRVALAAAGGAAPDVVPRRATLCARYVLWRTGVVLVCEDIGRPPPGRFFHVLDAADGALRAAPPPMERVLPGRAIPYRVRAWGGGLVVATRHRMGLYYVDTSTWTCTMRFMEFQCTEIDCFSPTAPLILVSEYTDWDHHTPMTSVRVIFSPRDMRAAAAALLNDPIRGAYHRTVVRCPGRLLARAMRDGVAVVHAPPGAAETTWGVRLRWREPSDIESAPCAVPAHAQAPACLRPADPRVAEICHAWRRAGAQPRTARRTLAGDVGVHLSDQSMVFMDARHPHAVARVPMRTPYHDVVVSGNVVLGLGERFDADVGRERRARARTYSRLLRETTDGYRRLPLHHIGLASARISELHVATPARGLAVALGNSVRRPGPDRVRRLWWLSAGRACGAAATARSCR